MRSAFDHLRSRDIVDDGVEQRGDIDVYKRQIFLSPYGSVGAQSAAQREEAFAQGGGQVVQDIGACQLAFAEAFADAPDFQFNDQQA